MEGRGGEARGEAWGWVSGVCDTERETEKRRRGAVFSVRCLPGLNESTCFLGTGGGV